MTDVFTLTRNQNRYLGQKLDGVSRSFALVVPALEEPLRQFLATAYLLCRTVDNIEDSTQPSAIKARHFADFDRLLSEPQLAREVLQQWDREAWPGLTDQERRMMGVAEGLELWEIYAALPTATQAPIREWAMEMARGMRQLNDPTKSPHQVRRGDIDVLRSKADYDEYCYYVAGTVGHLVTELVIDHYRLNAEIAHRLRARAVACGRSLQKTNIVKDFAEDVQRGVCYLPDTWLSTADYAPLTLRGAAAGWKAIVLDDVLDELQVATEYLLALPAAASGYRRAALLCLLPAYQTILLAAERLDRLFTAKHEIKISHTTMARCIADSHALLYDNPAIQGYSERCSSKIRAQFSLSDLVSER